MVRRPKGLLNLLKEDSESVFLFQARGKTKAGCVLKLDTDDDQVSHKTTYCFAFTNRCTLPLSVQVISLPSAIAKI